MMTPEWILTSVGAVFGLALSTYTAYTRNDKVISNRVTALEVRRESDSAQLARVETKIDKVLDHLLEKRQS